jgi:hypothetical protein
VDADPRDGVLGGEVLPLGPVAGTAGDDQVAAGHDRPGERGGHAAAVPVSAKRRTPDKITQAGSARSVSLVSAASARIRSGENALAVAHVAAYRDQPRLLASRLRACEIAIGSDLAATPVIKPEGRPFPPITAHAAASQPAVKSGAQAQRLRRFFIVPDVREAAPRDKRWPGCGWCCQVSVMMRS